MKTVVLEKNNLKARISILGACIEKLYFKGTEIGKDGIIVGRYANRISGGVIDIDGKEYRLSVNEGVNTLHGGAEGFNMKLWDLVSRDGNSAVLRLFSADKDQGFPGDLTVTVRYTLSDRDELIIDYSAETDSPTVINLTNHLYFNLNGSGAASDHMLSIDADHITETDKELIPTGKLMPVEGSRYDLRKAGRFVPGFDDNFVIRGSGLRKAAELSGIISGTRMEVLTDQPGVQLYNTETHICLETQHFADSPHRPEFPSTILRPGEIFTSRTIYRFTDKSNTGKQS